MKKKNLYWIVGIIILIIIFIAIFRGFSGEDDWIKDSSGAWIKHGNPSNIPSYVLESDTAQCALNLYQSASTMNMQFNSQCLGTCENYSIDIVHVPRNSDDNLPENQCSDYKNGLTNHFIELDKDGNVIRIA
jgi:hypothetical protein